MGFHDIGPSMLCDNHPNRHKRLHWTAQERDNCANKFATGDRVVVDKTAHGYDNYPVWTATVTRDLCAPSWYTVVADDDGKEYDVLHRWLTKV